MDVTIRENLGISSKCLCQQVFITPRLLRKFGPKLNYHDLTTLSNVLCLWSQAVHCRKPLTKESQMTTTTSLEESSNTTTINVVPHESDPDNLRFQVMLRPTGEEVKEIEKATTT